MQICRDSATVELEQTIELAGDAVALSLTLESTIDDWSGHPVVGPDFLPTLAGQVPADAGVEVTPDLLKLVGSMPLEKLLGMMGEAADPVAFERLAARTRE